MGILDLTDMIGEEREKAARKREEKAERNYKKQKDINSRSQPDRIEAKIDKLLRYMEVLAR